MVQVVLRGRFRGVHELLVAHVAFTAAEEDVRTLLSLHTLVAVEDMKVGVRNTHKHTHTHTHTHNPLHFEIQEWLRVLCKVHRTHRRNDVMQKARKHTHTYSQTHTPLLPLHSLIAAEDMKQHIYKITPTQANTHTSALPITHTFSISLSHSHQIKAKGSGSRPRLAPHSPGRPGGAV